MRKVILLLVMCCSLTGCAGGGLYNVAAASYEGKVEYHDKGLEEASNGWVLVSDTVGNLDLSAPKGGTDKTVRAEPLTVDHHLKIWWQPAKKLLFAVSYYTRSGTRLFVGSAYSALDRGNYSYNQVGQSISVLDLEKFTGFTQYNAHHNTLPPVEREVNAYGILRYGGGIKDWGSPSFGVPKTAIPNYHVQLESAISTDYLMMYENFDQFYSNNDIKTYMFREPSSRGHDLSLQKTLAGQSEWFSFDRSLWSPFLRAAEVNGDDKSKWAAWDARKFFLKDLQIHLPGVYVATDTPYTTTTFERESNPADRPDTPKSTYFGHVAWALVFSEDTGRFMKSTEASSAEVKAKLDSISGVGQLIFHKALNKEINRGADPLSAMQTAQMKQKPDNLGKSVADLLLLRAMGGQKPSASNEKSDGEGEKLGQVKTSEKVGEEIPDAAIQQVQAEFARKLAEIVGNAVPATTVPQVK